MAYTLTSYLGGTDLPPLKDPAYTDSYGDPIYEYINQTQSELVTKTVDQDFSDKNLTRALLGDYGEPVASLTIGSGGATPWDIAAKKKNHARLTLTEDVTLSISNPTATGNFFGGLLFITQDATGGRTVTWPASVQSAPTVTSTANKTDVYLLWTIDGGTKYFVQTIQTSISL